MTQFPRMTFKEQNGREISFRDYIGEYGSEGLYDPDFAEILKSWRLADWCDCDDYIAPMAAQIITDAAELDPVMYEKIMTVIVEAYEKFGPIINPPPTLHRIK